MGGPGSIPGGAGGNPSSNNNPSNNSFTDQINEGMVW